MRKALLTMMLGVSVLLLGAATGCTTTTSTRVAVKDFTRVGVQYADGEKTVTLVPFGAAKKSPKELFRGKVAGSQDLRLSVEGEKSMLLATCTPNCSTEKYPVMTVDYVLPVPTLERASLGKGKFLAVPLRVPVLANGGKVERVSGAPMASDADNVVEAQALVEWDNVTVSELTVKSASTTSIVGLIVTVIGVGAMALGTGGDNVNQTIGGTVLVLVGCGMTLGSLLWSDASASQLYPPGP